MAEIVIHGPSLDLLNGKEVSTYSTVTLESINQKLENMVQRNKLELGNFQSDYKDELIDKFQVMKDDIDFIVINPASFTTISIAMHDTLLVINVPFIKTHLSSTEGREDFRHISYFSDIDYGTASGFGDESYEVSICATTKYYQQNSLAENY